MPKEKRKTAEGAPEGRTKKKKTVWIVLAALLALTVVFYWVIREDWSVTQVRTEALNRDMVLPEMDGTMEIVQTFPCPAESTFMMTLQANLLPGWVDANLTVTITDEGVVQYEGILTKEDISADGTVTLRFDDPMLTGGRGLKTLTIGGQGQLSFWAGNSRNAGKFTVETETEGRLTAGGLPVQGALVMQQTGYTSLPYTRWFWPVAGLLWALALAVFLGDRAARNRGKSTPFARLEALGHKYFYLLKTLVVRDFQVKYKASVLGVLWSFLNPLIMTFVYLFVFSTLFRSSVPHFPVYLMSGIVLFNYCSDATTLGMQSIVGNAGLITKVYMPKYILPLSKVLSSAINLGISLIPLLLIMAINGVAFHKSLLLLPLLVVFVIVFCVGISLILSSAMVYFRDTQFLWGILLTIWNFLSPIFYPESIIPTRFSTLYHMNPLYQYLFFMRTITIGGVSPTPVTYVYCCVASLGALGLGALLFRKCQSQFVLHL